MITQAFFDKLDSDPMLEMWLHNYRGRPAIFTAEPIPGDARFPYVVTVGEVGQTFFDTKVTVGRDFVRDIRCFTGTTGSVMLIDKIANRVWDLFHKTSLTIDGNKTIFCTAGGPIVNDSEAAYGRVVSVRAVFTKA